MKRLLAIFGLLSVLGSATPVHAEAEARPDDSWFQRYYEHPQPERFESEMKTFSAAHYLQTEGAQPPIEAFCSRLFQAAPPDRLTHWVAFIRTLPPEDERIFLVALRWADMPATLDALRTIAAEPGENAKAARELLDAKAPVIETVSGTDPDELDRCWGAFFATGDARYVLPVIRCAAAPLKGTAADAVRGAAGWSLKALCATHPRVKEIKDGFYATATPEQRGYLDDLFKE